jgi:predicted SnoaL-like aldol condensation-catalyzing enzyme
MRRAVVWSSLLVIAASPAISAQTARPDCVPANRDKALVERFYDTVMVGRDVGAAPRFLAPGYIQHNPHVAGGLDGFMKDFGARFARPVPASYKREVLAAVGENDRVVIYNRQSWIDRDGKPQQALGFDLFRVQDGMIVEHWDIED